MQSFRVPSIATARTIDLRVIFVVLLIALAACTFAEPAFGATIDVPAGSGTLQAAITAAGDGDTLQLAAGEYTTSGYVVIAKNLAIVGAGRDATVITNTTSTAGISASTPTTTGWFQVNSPGSLNVSHLTFDGGALRTPAVNTGGAVYAQAPFVADDIRLVNVKASTHYGVGLILIGAGPHSVSNSVFDVAGRVGVYVGASPLTASTAPILPPTVVYSAIISNCTFQGMGPGTRVQYGFEVGRSGRALVENCTFSQFSGIVPDTPVDSNSGCVLASSLYGGGVATLVLRDCTLEDSIYGLCVGYPTQTRDTWVDVVGTVFDRVDHDLMVEGAPTVLRLPQGAGNFVADGDWDYTATDQTGAEIIPAPALYPSFFNRAPLAFPNSYGIDHNSERSVPAEAGVLADDIDSDEDRLGALLVSAPSKGTVVLNEDGSFVYRPASGASGTDSFTYRAKDKFSHSAPTVVTLVISAPSAPLPPTSTPGALVPVYRFFHYGNGTHFYTPDLGERDQVIKQWSNIYRYEGVAYCVNPATATQPLYRFFNLTNGSHFYTASSVERDSVRANWPNIYRYEGPTYSVSPGPVPGVTTVYRFFRKDTGSHFYTASAEEREIVNATWPHIYRDEGAAFWLEP